MKSPSMLHVSSTRWFCAAACAALFLGSAVVFADEGSSGFHDGRWRIEVSGAVGYDSGRHDREGDSVFTGNVEYEWPVYARCTLGLRAYPLFMYDQNHDDPTVWGGGVGVVGRIYQNKEERRGLFVEAGVAAMGQDEHIQGNSSSINFLSEGGVGYQFKNNWHVTLEVQHISNAHLTSENAGANSVGLAVGFSF